MNTKTKNKISYQLTFSESYSDIILSEIADIYDVDKDLIFKGSRKKNIIYSKKNVHLYFEKYFRIISF